jgi:hypothetical protein
VDQVRTSTLQKTGLAAAAAAALIAVGMPLAFAAAPPSDGEGYVDSTARCTTPDTAVLFGTTKSSRVAICKTTTGAYEYRGVRVSDGAKLIASAKQTSDDTFVVNNDGVTYTVTPTALSVTAGGDTFRTETWSDFHSSPQAPASSTAADSATSSSTPTSSKPTTSGTAAPTTSKSATASATSAAPLPPPMAAEVGGDSSSGE